MRVAVGDAEEVLRSTMDLPRTVNKRSLSLRTAEARGKSEPGKGGIGFRREGIGVGCNACQRRLERDAGHVAWFQSAQAKRMQEEEEGGREVIL